MPPPALLRPALAWMSWSSGKDSALALDAVREDPRIKVTGLLTTINAHADRVAMHAVRRSLLEAQADRLGVPLHVVEIPSPCSNDLYEQRMGAAMRAAIGEGVTQVIFGDLFLEDVRAYRERSLHSTGITPVFPLWGRPTAEVARQILERGIRAVVTCIDPRCMPQELVGRNYDEQFVTSLPPTVDPCGEHGEFHTFVWDGPGFTAPIDVMTGEVTQRDGFVFCDVRPR
jgi:uncharacterized protein (TIGR00290 family)